MMREDFVNKIIERLYEFRTTKDLALQCSLHHQAEDLVQTMEILGMTPPPYEYRDGMKSVKRYDWEKSR